MKSAQNQPKTTYLQKSLINVVPEKVHTSHPHPVEQMPNENIMYVQQVFYSIRRCSCVMCFFIRTLFYSSLLGGSSISAHVYFGRKKRHDKNNSKKNHDIVSYRRSGQRLRCQSMVMMCVLLFLLHKCFSYCHTHWLRFTREFSFFLLFFVFFYCR